MSRREPCRAARCWRAAVPLRLAAGESEHTAAGGEAGAQPMAADTTAGVTRAPFGTLPGGEAVELTETYRITVTNFLAGGAWFFALRLLGDMHKWPAIYEANKAVIGDDPNKIEVGQVLTIPA